MKPARTISLVLAALLALLPTLNGCRKSDTVDPSSTITLTEDDAADAFANALGGGLGTCGFMKQIEEAATVAGGASLPKPSDPASITVDTTVTRQKTGMYSYSYVFHYTYGLASANRFTFSYSMAGSYETPSMTSSDSATGSIELSNLLVGQTYTAAALYNRNGMQVSKVRNKISFKSTITMSIANLLVDKTTKQITGGTATLTISGQTGSVRIFAFTSTLTFLGAQQATLSIGNRMFTLDLSLGTATRVV